MHYPETRFQEIISQAKYRQKNISPMKISTNTGYKYSIMNKAVIYD